jgi:N-acetylmuramoyl-L-alanine amidase
MLLASAPACHNPPAGGSAGSRASRAGSEPDVAQARLIAEGRAPLPERDAARALAEAVEASADDEGSGARAVELRTTAARIAERTFRTVGDERDAARALALYKAAAVDMGTPGACDAARRAATLAGDAAHDASIAYTELYRVERARRARMPAARASAGRDEAEDAACDRDVDETLARLAAFRPPQSVLDAVDERLAREGATPFAADGGAPWTPPPAGAAAQPPRIVRVDVWPATDSARVVVELDRAAAYRAGDEKLAGAPWPRTFLELDGVDPGGPPRDLPEEGVVTRVRTEASSTGSRVSVDLDGRAFRRVFYMQEPYRIVLDVARRPPGSSLRAPRELARIVIDPGHGGKDTGAVGPAGLAEKDVTLDVARRVARVLTGQGIAVLLTRDDDRFISLEERTARANAFSADLFVSIHCNASEGHGRRGVETYVLDTTSDEIAMRIAARENATTRAASADLASMLSSMRLADQAQRSTHFARLLERSALSALRMKYADVGDGGVHVAGFYVLVGARMPSALFESSYISNPEDEERLASADYRQLLADAIANAVQAYREGR